MVSICLFYPFFHYFTREPEEQLKALGVPVQKFVATTGFSITGTAKKSLQSWGKAGQMINCLSCLGRKRRAYYAGSRRDICIMDKNLSRHFEIKTLYDEGAPDCIGCLSCAKICPVNAIDVLETEDTRHIWNKTFTLIRCAQCGKPFATEEEIARLKTKLSPHGAVNLSFCPDCRKRTLLMPGAPKKKPAG